MLKSVELCIGMERLNSPNSLRMCATKRGSFLATSDIDLRARGLEEAQAAELRAQLGIFAEEWNSPDMDLYNNYDAAKAKL